MSNKNLLIELFVEELPPKALKKIGEAFAATLEASLKAQGLLANDSKLTGFASPRRLGAHISNVAAQAADKPIAQKLMPVAAMAQPVRMQMMSAVMSPGATASSRRPRPMAPAELSAIRPCRSFRAKAASPRA